jgi:hypothetical protein
LGLRAAASGSLYEAALGPAFAGLHPQVRRAHLPPLRAEGTMDVEHGSGVLARLIVRLMNLPGAGRRQPVRLDVSARGQELEWSRRIGSSNLRTHQRARASQLEERSGLARISFDLSVEAGALLYRQSALHLAGLPVPSSVSPHASAVVSGTVDGWRVMVTVVWRGRIVCRYAGVMRAS